MTDSGFKAALDFIDATVPDNHIEIEGAKLVVFDLETTDLAHSSEICQIAALYEESEFNVYVIPFKGISASASAVTGLTVTAGELFLDDVRLDTTPPKIALLKFIQYLKEVSQERGVILVAHNGFRFDTPVILRHMRQYELFQEFTSNVKGFSDTLPVFRKQLPERVRSKGKFSQGSLAQEYLGSDALQGAHNALEDVRVLDRLINVLGVTGDALKDQARTIKDILKSQQMAAVETCNKATLECLKNEVSAGMRTKIAKAGINLEILQKTFKEGSDNAVALLLGEDVRGHPRVTKNKKVLQGIMLALHRISCDIRKTN